MPDVSSFPHLNLTFRGIFTPKFQGGGKKNAEVLEILANPHGQATKVRGIIRKMRRDTEELLKTRKAQGLPAIPAGKGFLLRLPEGVDVDQITHALGVELVAETDEGLMLVSAQTLDFAKLEEVLNAFEAGTGGKIAGSSILDIYDNPDDEKRLRNILAAEILEKWPLDDNATYIFDLGVQTAPSTRTVNWPRVKQRDRETDEEFQKRREIARQEAWIAADTEWQDNAEARVNELTPFIHHYDGQILSGIIAAQARHEEIGIVFPDSVQVRIRMTGAGLRDIILNFPHLFDVALPPDVQQEITLPPSPQELPEFMVLPPEDAAAAVCIIDSGIEEGHKWLASAIDSKNSRCFLPNVQSNDVADYVSPQGHGTRVAGAVLYPSSVPTNGAVTAIAWLQNARVLNNQNQLPDTLPPEEYLRNVVAHFHTAPRFTKIFNHSINANLPCPRKRMTAWAAKIDQISHEQEVLFIQSAGNQNRDHGTRSNPGLCDHLSAGRQPPEHQLTASMRVADPAQSLHALTVGSISATTFEDADVRTFATNEHGPSGFSRTGYGEPWSVVKPEVVEIGGDVVYSKNPPYLVNQHPNVSIELLNSTRYGVPASSKDGVGTSYAAPKVAHIAAYLQNLFPTASPLLYRALIVQSARWPGQPPKWSPAFKLVFGGMKDGAEA